VIGHDLGYNDLPAVLDGDFDQEFIQLSRHGPAQNSPVILGAPHEMQPSDATPPAVLRYRVSLTTMLCPDLRKLVLVW
jgi:hypothetical protein